MSLFAVAAAGPKAGLNENESVKHSGPPMIHCEDQVGNNIWLSPSSATTSNITQTVNHGQWGTVSIDQHVNDMHCFIDFAHECDAQGVDIEFTKMKIEYSEWLYDDDTKEWDEYDGCEYDHVSFDYTDANGDHQKTDDDLCGDFNVANPKFAPVQTKYSLIGTDMKMVVSTDFSISDGFTEFNWQCRSYGNDICPSKYDGTKDSGCYTQSAPWHPGKDVSCSMTNDDCMSTTCSATGISAFFRKDLFHTNSQNTEHITKQIHDGTRAIYIEGSSTPLTPNDVSCGFGMNPNGIWINWEYGNVDCPLAPTMNANGKIEYSVKLVSPGNEPGFETIEFYVDTVVSASCQYDPEVDVEADGFWINQEDVDAETSKFGSLANNFDCRFFEDENAKNQIMEHNIVNMGERIYGRVKSKNAGGYGLIYKLQRVTFTDASGKIDPPPSFHVIGGGSGGQGSTIVEASVQMSKYVPNKRYWRPVGRNMKFSFLSFGFENLSDQNEVDVKCRIKIDIDPVMFPDSAASGSGVRNMVLHETMDYDMDLNWGQKDYYDNYE